MSRPIAVFGLPEDKVVKKILTLRKKLFSEGKVEEAELLTLPHLTILINTTLDDMISNDFIIAKLKPFVSVVKQFPIKITSIEKFDNSVIAKFDNSFTRKLVYQMSSVLPGFRAVTTDYIKIVRRVVPENIDSVVEESKSSIPEDLIIDKIAMAGGLLKKEDIIWTGDLVKPSPKY